MNTHTGEWECLRRGGCRDRWSRLWCWQQAVKRGTRISMRKCASWDNTTTPGAPSRNLIRHGVRCLARAAVHWSLTACLRRSRCSPTNVWELGPGEQVSMDLWHHGHPRVPHETAFVSHNNSLARLQLAESGIANPAACVARDPVLLFLLRPWTCGRRARAHMRSSSYAIVRSLRRLPHAPIP